MAYLPHLNALLNALAAVCLCAGFFFIRRKNVRAHRACMVGALGVSALFLVSYLVYHYTAGATKFTGQGVVRPIYFAILISHTVLAVAVLPLALITAARALKGRFERHKAIARWTLPIWLYVSVTGVVVYVMLYHLYASSA